ncbi:AAA-like domain-containing protein [Tumidithrix elongata RA019]|uniref:AAA-like domain-containing protein n=1 Tax=Tumidithrix elongata BACA0141 TaxID=2716417 RepID=A0AAW9PWL4_9CYAN|nr:AAA-like domain-containing protein [Tumidithrix elongata RA019]
MYYQVGGSLTSNNHSYITRQSDLDLYEALKQDEFCFVLNSRQMGKSSLLVRTRHRLQQEGYACTVVDMTNIGSDNITPLQWYKGIVTDLWRGFKPLRKFDLKTWWNDESDLSLLQRLSRFIDDVLLNEIPDQKIVIFIDEIDSILSLPFPVDDFFAFIRFCYNQRAIAPEYKRINFAIFGVATPGDLIRDRKRTAFNLGKAIALSGFTLEESQPLAQGLVVQEGNAQIVLQEILNWTGGQPFLTQKLCQLAIGYSQDAVSGQLTIPPGTEAYWVENMVRERLLKSWESQDEPEHLRTIRNRILNHREFSGRLLGIYQQVLQSSTSKSPAVPADDSREQVELILSGLIIKDGGHLCVKNRIYAEVFNLDWVQQQLNNLRPYSQMLDRWVLSDRQDESRLLRGQALREAQAWAHGRWLSDLDYQFIASSVESDRHQVQQALEAERTEAVEAQLIAVKKNMRLQRWFLGTVSLALLATVGLGIATFLQYRQARQSGDEAKISAVKARTSEVEALISSASGNFDSHRQLEALLQALEARTKLKNVGIPDLELTQKVQTILRKIVDGITETNILSVGVGVRDVAIAPNGKRIATASVDGRVQLWQPDGKLIKDLLGHQGIVYSVKFNREGTLIATASADKTIKLWRPDGTLVRTINGDFPFQKVEFNPNGQQLISINSDRKTQLWDINGTLVKELPPSLLATFSPDGQFILSIAPILPSRKRGLQTTDPAAQVESSDEPTPPPNTRLMRTDGSSIAEFPTERGPIFAIAFSPNSQTFATASVDGNVSIWDMNGKRLKQFIGHESKVQAIAFSPDGKWMATSGADKTLRLWQVEGGLDKSFYGHQANIQGLAFSPDGQWLASASDDGTARFWQPHRPLWDILSSHSDVILRIAFAPDNSQLLSVSVDMRMNFWQRETGGDFNLKPHQEFINWMAISGLAFSPDGKQIAMAFREGKVEVRRRDGSIQQLDAKIGLRGAAFSPDGKAIAAGSIDNTVKLWTRDDSGQFIDLPRVLLGHQGAVNSVAFSPDGKLILSGSGDKTIKLWNPDGTLLKTLTEHKAGVTSVKFSPNGDWIASASSDNTIKLWRKDGTFVRTFSDRATGLTNTSHAASVTDVGFSPDGQQLASASYDGTVKVWQLDGTLVRTLTEHEGTVETVAFSPDGKAIASAGTDRRVIVWHLDKISQLDEYTFACNWVRNYLKNSSAVTQKERDLLCKDIP